jgi:hypothetical protein
MLNIEAMATPAVVSQNDGTLIMVAVPSKSHRVGDISHSATRWWAVMARRNVQVGSPGRARA